MQAGRREPPPPYDRWDLSSPSRRLAHCHSVWLATLGTSDPSLWAHESMGLHLPPLRENTCVIQGWGIALGCLSRILANLQLLIGSMGRSHDLYMEPNQPIFCRWLPEALLISHHNGGVGLSMCHTWVVRRRVKLGPQAWFFRPFCTCI